MYCLEEYPIGIRQFPAKCLLGDSNELRVGDSCGRARYGVERILLRPLQDRLHVQIRGMRWTAYPHKALSLTDNSHFSSGNMGQHGNGGPPECDHAVETTSSVALFFELAAATRSGNRLSLATNTDLIGEQFCRAAGGTYSLSLVFQHGRF